MDLAFSAQDLEFQQEVRTWIEDNYPQEMRERMAASSNGYLPKDDQVLWQKRLFEKGWVAPNWPEEYGGPNFSATERYMYDLEMASANTPHLLPFGLTMVAPVIMKFGTQEQKTKYLPDILETNKWWCQGYSEPGSGSDLASLKTKAVREGDHYIVNGSKTWTTLAQHADMIFCLVRTSSDGIRQQGISFLLIDMNTPGIDVRPIITLDCAPEGAHEVNEVFFDNVKVPVENLVGEEGKGWTYAKYLLEFERGNAYSHGLKAALKKLRKIAKQQLIDGQPLIEDATYNQKLAETEIAISAMEFTELRILSSLSAGQNVGPESSLLKCRGTELQMQLTDLTVEAVDYYAVPFDNPGPAAAQASNSDPIGPDYAAMSAPKYFNYRKTAIYAGSNEVQRNIMAKLVLGL